MKQPSQRDTIDDTDRREKESKDGRRASTRPDEHGRSGARVGSPGGQAPEGDAQRPETSAARDPDVRRPGHRSVGQGGYYDEQGGARGGSYGERETKPANRTGAVTGEQSYRQSNPTADKEPGGDAPDQNDQRSRHSHETQSPVDTRKSGKTR